MTVRDFLSAVEGTRKVYVLRPEYSDEGYVKEENLCGDEQYLLAGSFCQDFNPELSSFNRKEVEALEVSWSQPLSNGDLIIHTKHVADTTHHCCYGECHNDNKRHKLCEYCVEHNISAEDCRNIWNILNLD